MEHWEYFCSHGSICIEFSIQNNIVFKMGVLFMKNGKCAILLQLQKVPTAKWNPIELCVRSFLLRRFYLHKILSAQRNAHISQSLFVECLCGSHKAIKKMVCLRNLCYDYSASARIDLRVDTKKEEKRKNPGALWFSVA